MNTSGIDFTVPVEVYWNLHKGVWSVRQRGKVVTHSPNVYLYNVKFVVRPAGRDRVRREGRKNVHAFAKGFLVSSWTWRGIQMIDESFAVTYNPYVNDTFVSGNTPVEGACYVAFTETRQVFATQLRGEVQPQGKQGHRAA